MTFQEKSLWITLVGLLVAFGGYAASAYATLIPAPVAKDLLPHQAGLFAGATILLVLILVAGHLVVALFDRHTEPDERDRSIARRASQYGSFVLATGVFLSLCTAMLTEGNAIMSHVLLGFWVVSHAVEIGVQLLQYRLER